MISATPSFVQARALIRCRGPLGAEVPITRVAPMEAIVRASLAEDRALTVTFAVFAGLALGLGAIGVFAVASAAVAATRSEIGVRIALGASSWRIARRELGRAGRLAGLGLGVGLLGAVVASRLVSGLLYRVDAFEPWVAAAVALVLLLVVALAVALPVARAVRVDPTRALAADG